MIANYSNQLSRLLLFWSLPLGMIVFMSGKIFLPGSASHITQTYIWLMFPALLFCIFGRQWLFKGYKPTKVEYSILLFLCFNVVSYFWSTTDKNFDRYYKDLLYIVLFLTTLSALIRSPKNNLVRVMEVAGLIAVIGAALSIHHYYITNDTSLNYRSFRIFNMGYGPFANFSGPIQAALYYGPFTLFFFIRFLDSKGVLTKQILFLLAVVILQTYILLTGSRGPTFSLFIGYIVLWSFRRDRLTTAFCIVVFGLAFGMGLKTNAIKYEFLDTSSAHAVRQYSKVEPLSAGSSFRELPTFQELEENLNERFNERGTIWFGAIEEILDAPWFGHGIEAEFKQPYHNNRQTASHPHSLYLQILYDTGLIGLTLFLSILSLTLKDGWKYRHIPLVQIALSILVFGLISYLIDVHKIFHRPHAYWFLFWLPVGIVIGIRLKETIGMISFTPEESSRRVMQTIVLDTPVNQRSKVQETEE